MADNLVRLDLSRFTARDVLKIGELGDKMRLLHRWFRCERLDGSDGETFAIFAGDRGPRHYASYRIARHEDGTYGLIEGNDGGKALADGRTTSIIRSVEPVSGAAASTISGRIWR